MRRAREAAPHVHAEERPPARAGGALPVGRRHAFAVLAVALVLAAFAEAWREQAAERIARLEPVPGQVLATRRAGGGTTRRIATVRFEAAGRISEVDQAILDPVKAGERTWVWLDPHDPAGTASLRRPASLRQGPGLLFAVAAVVALFGAGLAWELSGRERQAAAVAVRVRAGAGRRGSVSHPLRS